MDQPKQHLVDGKLAFDDLVNLDQLRRILEQYNKSTGVMVGLASYPDHKLLVSAGWCTVCTQFHRVNPESMERCRCSTRELIGTELSVGEISYHHCANGLIDGITPILISGVHVANLFTGQVFFAEPDLDYFRRQGRKYGYDIPAYLAAIREVPVVNEELFKHSLEFLSGLANMLVDQGLNAIGNRRLVEDMDRTAERLELALQGGDLGTWDWDILTDQSRYDERWVRMLGYSLAEIGDGVDDWEGMIHPDDLCSVREEMSRHLEGRSTVYDVEYRLRHKDGHWVWIHSKGKVIERDADNNPVRACGTHLDITKRKRVEAELNESEARHRILIENAPEAITVLDLACGCFVDCNVNAEKMFGVSRSELLKYGPAEISPTHQPDGRDSVTAAREFVAVAFDGEPQTFEWMHRNPVTGREFLCEVRLVRLPSSSQDLVRGSIVDITERKRTEQALRESEEHYREFFNNALFGLFRSRISDGLMTAVNSKTAELLGADAGEIVGKVRTVQLYRDPKQRSKLMDILAREGKVNAYEVDMVTLDGREVVFALSVRTYPEQDYLEGAVVDVTERKRIETALNEELELANSTMESLPGFFYIFNSEGRFIRWNRNIVEIAGFTDEEIAGMHAIEYFVEEDRPKVQQEIGRVFTEGYSEVEARVRFKDGTVKPFLMTGRRTVVGGEVCLVGMGLDLTDRMLAEEERLRYERQVLQAQKLESLGILAGGIAHDFNNLLMTILGNSDLALTDLSPHAPARSSIEEVVSAAKRAAALARQMLAYSGKGKFVIEPINLNELVTEMAHLLEVSIPKKVTLRINYADGLPVFDGDATQVRQIIMNLIVNASEAVGDRAGVVSINTGVMYCTGEYLRSTSSHIQGAEDNPLPAGDYVYVEVSDTGCGMDRETQQKIFDPFFSTKFTGRGLGLAATLGIIRGHRGAIMVYSEPGKGSTFKILFPAQEGVAAQEQMDGFCEVDLDWTGSGMVLVVDDEESIRAVGKRMLNRMEFGVLTARDGRDAISVYRQHRNEIVGVMLDLTMPQLDGEETFRELRRIDPGVKVLLCSGYSEQEATQRFTGKGLSGFIQKPFTFSELRSKLREVLEK